MHTELPTPIVGVTLACAAPRNPILQPSRHIFGEVSASLETDALLWGCSQLLPPLVLTPLLRDTAELDACDDVDPCCVTKASFC